MRVDSITIHSKSLLEKLYESGLREVFLGIESGSEKTLNTFNKKASKDDNINAIKLYEEFGIKVNAGNILATADSTVEDVCESIKVFEEMKLGYLLFRRIKTKALVFPGTQYEDDLFNGGFINKKGDYILSTYTFLDSRVGILVTYLEKYLPFFLTEIGDKIFPLRNRSLVIHNSNKEKTDIPLLLSNWSKITTDFLLYWFEEVDNELINEEAFFKDFNLYIEKTKIIYNKLLKLVNDIPYSDFYADTF